MIQSMAHPLKTAVLLVALLAGQDPGPKVPARLALKPGDALSYKRRSTIVLELEVERGGEKKKGRHEIAMTLDVDLKVLEAGDTLRCSMAFRRAAFTSKSEGALGSKESSWELPKPTAPELRTLECGPGGRLLKTEGKDLRSLFAEAGCDRRLAKIPAVYGTAYGEDPRKPDGGIVEGIVLPAAESATWELGLHRMYGFTGLIDDFSGVREDWSYVATESKDGALTVKATLAKVVVGQAFGVTGLEVEKKTGEGVVVLDAATGLPRSTDLAWSMTFKASDERQSYAGTLTRTERCTRD